MIYFKLILACILSAVPFFYVSYIRPKKNTSSVWRNMFTAIGSQMPRLYVVKIALSKLLHKLYEGMKKHDSFRQFFTLIFLLVMIAVQFVDFNASTTVAQIMQNAGNSSETAQAIIIYGPMMTRPQATILAACVSFLLFSYSTADWVLTRLHNNKRIFLFMATVILFILLASPRYFIMAEIMELLLMAALIYPNKVTQQPPKGHKHIPDEKDKMIKIAA